MFSKSASPRLFSPRSLLVVALGFSGFVLAYLPDAWAMPADPTDIRTWGLKGNKTKITWKDNAGDEDEYRVERSSNGGSFSEIATLAADTTQYIDDGFDTSNTYRYRVRAYRASDTSFSNFTDTSLGPQFLTGTNFRMFYNTGECFPTTGDKKNCTPNVMSGMQNEYAARINDVLDGSLVEFVTNFGFNNPYNPEGGEPLPVNLKYCDGGGCAGGCGIGLAPAFSDPYDFTMNSGDPGMLVVPAHELFHMIQFSYDAVKSDPAGAWVTEAQARAIQDLVCIDAGGLTCQNVDDEPGGIAPYYGQVNAYLGNTNRPINELSYTACLFWTYLCQEYGSNMAEPQLGLDFLEKFWDEADDDKNRDGIQVVDATLKNINASFSFKAAFKDFVIASYAKDLSGAGVPSKYQYVDETQTPGSFDPVALELSEDISGMDQIGPMLADVQKWGAVYHEIRPDNTVPYIQVDYSVDNGVPAFFCLLAIKGGEIDMEIRHEGVDFEESFANNNYDAITIVVAGLANDVNYRYSVNGTQPIINILDPLTGRKAKVGDKAAPEKFVAKVEVLDPDSNPIEGIDAGAFNFEIGPQTLGAGNIVTNAYVQGQYWFVIQAPTQTVNTDYDFVASWSVLSDTETNAIDYVMRADADNMLVIDKSGSMNTPMSKIADAKDAANLYVDSWREGDKIGVASFNCTSDPSDLTLRDWDDMSRMDAHSEINGIGAGGGTSIGNGLQEGLDELIARGAAAHQWAIILLSDGNNTCDPDIADFLSTYTTRKDNGDQLPQVHAVAIGADANRPDLENLANKTGGTYQFASEPSPKGPGGADFGRDMAEIYRVISEKITRTQQVLIARDELRRLPINLHKFTVDGGASELVVVAKFEPFGSEPEVVLRDPMGGEHPASNSIINRHKVYRVGAPIPGEWEIELRCQPGTEFCNGAEYLVEGAVKSSLTMDMFFVLPVEDRIIGTPMPVLVSLTDSGPIKGAIVALGMEDPNGNSSGLFLFDDGLHGDGSAGDGIYGNTIYSTGKAGTYRVQSVAIGESDDFGPFVRRVLESFVMRGDADIDQDRMPDSYEERVGLIVGENDAGGDPDKDDLNNFQECQHGTDPFDPDTDDGGENDGSEVFNQRNPHEPGDDVVKPPRLVAVPGVNRTLVRFNIPILPGSEDINDVTYTFEIQRCLGLAGEFLVHENVYHMTDTPVFQYEDNQIKNGELAKYRFYTVGPNGERSAPSNIVTVTPTLDPYPPYGGIVINDGAGSTDALMAELRLFAEDGYDPEYDFPDRDELDPAAEVSGVADMMISNFSSGFDGVWEPFAEIVPDWPLMPNQSDIATVYAKFRDNAGCVSEIYQASIKVFEPAATPTSTATSTATPTETGTPTPTATTTCGVQEGDYDLNGDNEVNAEDLLELLEAIRRDSNDPKYDFNCDGTSDETDAAFFATKWKRVLTP